MKLRLALAAAAVLAGSVSAADLTVTRNGTQLAAMGGAANFTGAVVSTPLFDAKEPARASAGQVTFEPGARSAWHTHPLGQTLIVTAGQGWVQREGGNRQEINPGDVVWTPPGVKHWHGATATSGMSHIAIQESLNGKRVSWLEKVSDEQYGK